MRISMFRPRMIAVAAAAALVVPLAGVSSAQAADRQFIFFYNSGAQGSNKGFTNSVSDLAGYTFVTPYAGQGQYVKNNSASVDNGHYTKAARVYFNSGYAGANDYILSDSIKNLTNTYNENASFKFIS